MDMTGRGRSLRCIIWGHERVEISRDHKTNEPDLIAVGCRRCGWEDIGQDPEQVNCAHSEDSA